MTGIRYHSSDDMTSEGEWEGVIEPVAVVIRPDGSIDAYGYVAVIDQRADAGLCNGWDGCQDDNPEPDTWAGPGFGGQDTTYEHVCQDPAYGPCPRPECGQPYYGHGRERPALGDD